MCVIHEYLSSQKTTLNGTTHVFAYVIVTDICLCCIRVSKIHLRTLTKTNHLCGSQCLLHPFTSFPTFTRVRSQQSQNVSSTGHYTQLLNRD